jgi:hypothetical protein
MIREAGPAWSDGGITGQPAMTWTISERLKITSIEPWNLLVGAERLASPRAAAAMAR